MAGLDPMAVKAAFFDIDGTLVDSNGLHVEAWGEAFGEAGISLDPQAIHDQIGKGSDNLVPSLLPDADEARQKAIGGAHGRIFKARYLDRVQPFAGAKDLLMRVHSTGRAVVLASSASQAELDHYIDLLGAADLVSATTSADEVRKTKPASDIFATALKKLEPISAAEIVAIGDTPYDVEAAGKCGIATIGLRSGGFDDADLLDAGAIALYGDVAALLAGFEASPLAQ